jgi:two-component system, NtrC family, sensor kinase
MILQRLAYRIQIPLGLSLAVVVAALLVTAVAAQISARSARLATLATIDRAVELLVAQARPLLAADDTWRVFALLRNTAALLPGAAANSARAAVLDADGRVFAASDPTRLETGKALLGEPATELPDEVLGNFRLPAASGILQQLFIERNNGAVLLIHPIQSEDGQTLGFAYIEIDASVFAPNWAALSQPALIGAGMAVALLVPAGWWMGRRMTRPVADLAEVIERIGREAPAVLQADVPRTNDPELGRIGDAVAQLISELASKQRAEARALSAERLAAVGRMTAAVAHEINNPLGGLLTATQTLRLHGATDSTRLRTVDLLERGLQQIRSTVAALLPQARIEDRPLEPSDLEDVLTLARAKASRLGVEMQAQTEIESAMRVPSAVMRQVMLNLLLNAVNAAGENGEVEAVLTSDADTVQFSVINSGKTLDMPLFEQTMAAEDSNDPRGFGLWICREIAIQFGGGFSPDSHHQIGTKMIFWMPNKDAINHKEDFA